MILEVDMGNSFLKWRLRDLVGSSSAPVRSVKNLSPGCPDYAQIFSGIDKAPESILVSCVVPASREAFSCWCVDHWSIVPEYAVVSRQYAGVTNAYIDVAQMGVDRWLAMLAAYSRGGRASLVVDAGTALTVDLLLASGKHLGGYITPGLKLMDQVLFGGTEIRETDRVNDLIIDYDGGLGAGDSTERAVFSGLYSMQLGLLSLSLNELAAAGGSKPDVYFAGGSGLRLSEVFSEYLSGSGGVERVRSIVFEPTLVLDGLSLSAVSK